MNFNLISSDDQCDYLHPTQRKAKHGLNVIFIEKNGVMYFEK